MEQAGGETNQNGKGDKSPMGQQKRSTAEPQCRNATAGLSRAVSICCIRRRSDGAATTNSSTSANGGDGRVNVGIWRFAAVDISDANRRFGAVPVDTHCTNGHLGFNLEDAKFSGDEALHSVWRRLEQLWKTMPDAEQMRQQLEHHFVSNWLLDTGRLDELKLREEEMREQAAEEKTNEESDQEANIDVVD